MSYLMTYPSSFMKILNDVGIEDKETIDKYKYAYRDRKYVYNSVKAAADMHGVDERLLKRLLYSEG